MRAIVLTAFGGPEVLHLEDRPLPEPGPGEVRVRIRAAGVCGRDLVDRRGGFPMLRPPIVTGHELAGEVDAVGPGVTRWRVGDRVVNRHRGWCGTCARCAAGDPIHCQTVWQTFGLTVDGGYAEATLALESALEPLPAPLAYTDAASLCCTYGTALHGLEARAGLRAGETVLVTGASGGVGLAAVHLARLLGARVVAQTSSAARAAALHAAGAEHVVVSDGSDLHKRLPELPAGGVDVALDCVGVPTLNGALRSLRPEGRLVVLGNVTGGRLELNPGLVILKSLTLLGSDTCTPAELRRVLDWAAAGALPPGVDRVLPLECAAEAQGILERREAVGRVVLST